MLITLCTTTDRHFRHVRVCWTTPTRRFLGFRRVRVCWTTQHVDFAYFDVLGGSTCPGVLNHPNTSIFGFSTCSGVLDHPTCRFRYFRRVVPTTNTYHPRKWARRLVFEGGGFFSPPPPSKTSWYALFRGWWLLFCHQHSITLENEPACSFSRVVGSFRHHQHHPPHHRLSPSKMSRRARFWGWWVLVAAKAYHSQSELACSFSRVVCIY